MTAISGINRSRRGTFFEKGPQQQFQVTSRSFGTADVGLWLKCSAETAFGGAKGSAPEKRGAGAPVPRLRVMQSPDQQPEPLPAI